MRNIFINKNRYKNPYSKGLKNGLFAIFLWKMGFLNDGKKNKRKKPPKDFSGVIKESNCVQDKPKVVWINHSSFLIEINGIHILTDPIWSRTCSSFSFIGPFRRHKVPFPLEKLPKIDYVLISHNHYDHLDKRTVKKLYQLFPKIKWIVPEGVKSWFVKNAISLVSELTWWQTLSLKDMTITSVPTQHFSGRKFTDYNKSLWTGYVLEEPKTKKRVYFAGDTGYNEYDFKKIGEKWGKIDLALIPIGCYLPRAFTQPVHIDPYEAVKIHKEINSQISIAMHWKTFKLSDESLFLPPYDLHLAKKQQEIEDKRFIVLEPGVYVNW